MALKRKQIFNISLFISTFFIVTLNISDISASPSIPIKTVKISKAGEWAWPDNQKRMNTKAIVPESKENGLEKIKIHEEPKPKKFEKSQTNIKSNINEQTPVNRCICNDSNLKITTNKELLDCELPERSLLSFAAEPSIAANDGQVIITGNWFSSISDDQGASFAYLDVQNNFYINKDIESLQGDQVVVYSHQQKCFLWSQLWCEGTGDECENGKGTRFIRLIVKKGLLTGGEAYAIYNIKPNIFFEPWNKLSFDFPDLAVSKNFLYVSALIIESVDKETNQSLVMRIPLEKITNYEGDFDAEYCTVEGYCPRLTQGISETMFFASYKENCYQIRVHEWKQDKQGIEFVDLNVDPWVANKYDSLGPDGEPWLGRMASNITAAWVSSDELNKILGFAWTAGHDDAHPYPHVRVALITQNEKGEYHVFDQPHIWNASFAFAYPSICLNEKGQTGISLFFGGNILYPSHAVGIYDMKDNKWKLYWTAVGTDSPNNNKWGDYLTIRPHPTKNNAWITSGFTLNGGSRAKDLSIKFIQFESN